MRISKILYLNDYCTGCHFEAVGGVLLERHTLYIDPGNLNIMPDYSTTK